MRIFTLPPTVGSSPEPNFYDSLQKVRLRQQLEMYSLGEHKTSPGLGAPTHTGETLGGHFHLINMGGGGHSIVTLKKKKDHSIKFSFTHP